MKWIGLTGGIASGKSTVSKMLKDHAIAVVDADEIAKSVVQKGSPGLKSIVTRFGNDVLLSDGQLDRKKISELVFGDHESLRDLESITHPLIRAEVLRQRTALEHQNLKLAIYDIPLLFETKSEDQFDAIILVSCSVEQQKTRLRQRSELAGLPLDESQIQKRIASQISIADKEQKADFVIRNDLDQKHLASEVARLIQWLNGL
jgi:dephospho-CoA kinase